MNLPPLVELRKLPPVLINVVGGVLAVDFDGVDIPFELLNDQELEDLKAAFDEDGRGVASEGPPGWVGRAHREMKHAIADRRAELERYMGLTEEQRLAEQVASSRYWHGENPTVALP